MYDRGFNTGFGDMMRGIGAAELLFLMFAALVVVGIVVLIVLAARGGRGHSSSGAGQGPGSISTSSHDEAVVIARRRLATGEITKEQYDEIMTALGG